MHKERHYYGKNGESVFTSPLLISEQYYYWDTTVKDILSCAEEAKDDRSLVINYALAFEMVIDNSLSTFIPRYKELLEDDLMTFSLKIRLFKSMKLIPNHLLECADIIRKIRNEFAHNLNVHKLKQIKSKKLKTAFLNLFTKHYKSKSIDYNFMLSKIARLGIAGISAYHVNLTAFGSTIMSQPFQELVEHMYAANDYMSSREYKNNS